MIMIPLRFKQMNIPFFFEPDLQEANRRYTLTESSARHCVQVLRKKKGDFVMLTDGRGRLFKAVVESAERKDCHVAILGMENITVPAPKNAIGISFTKNISRIEWFLEKATEIGIAEIFPLQTHRTERSHYNRERLQNILVAAMLQSGQAWLPVLSEALNFDQLVTGNNYTGKYIAHCDEDEKHPFVNELQKGGPQRNLILIGPEGDFTPEEILLAKTNRFIPVSLGATRLRTETAGVTACVLMNFIHAM